jgi:hypothetical protein
MVDRVVHFSGSEQSQSLVYKYPKRVIPSLKPQPLPTPAELLSFNYSLPSPSSNPPVDLIKATYTLDLDLFRIHQTMRSLFSSQFGSVVRLENEIRSLREKQKLGYLSCIEADRVNLKIKDYSEQIEKYRSEERWNSYVEQAKPILEAYLPLTSDEIKGIIRFGEKEVIQTKEQIQERHFLIKKYLAIVENYIELDILREIEYEFKCPGCDSEFQNVILEGEEGMQTCDCGFQQSNLTKTFTFKDGMRVNVGGRSGYKDRLTFIKTLEHFMGIKIPKIPEKLYEMLDEYFFKEGFPSGKHVQEHFPLLPNGHKKGTSVDLMVKALAATSNTSFYDCINHIGSVYWGWKLPDLSELRETIIKDYDETQKIYERIRERGSSLNAQIRVFAHLKTRGYECDFSNFKILTTRESLEYHHRMLKIMFEQVGLPVIPII